MLSILFLSRWRSPPEMRSIRDTAIIFCSATPLTCPERLCDQSLCIRNTTNIFSCENSMIQNAFYEWRVRKLFPHQQPPWFPIKNIFQFELLLQFTFWYNCVRTTNLQKNLIESIPVNKFQIRAIAPSQRA